MIFVALSSAKEIQCASKAGLVLAGSNRDGELEWIGKEIQHLDFKTLMAQL